MSKVYEYAMDLKEQIALPQVQTQRSNMLSTNNIWLDKDAFEQAMTAATFLSETSLIPQTYQGRPQDCLVAMDMANRMNISPMVVMQNMYVVRGKPSWSGQSCTMMINANGKFKNGKHVYFGDEGKDDRGCYYCAERIQDGEIVNGAKVTIAMAKSEGWTNNSKWKTMPELMMAYRASAFFARVHCPEALMGVHLDGEVEDFVSAPVGLKTYTCEDCGDENVPENTSVFTQKTYGRILCNDCKSKITYEPVAVPISDTDKVIDVVANEDKLNVIEDIEPKVIEPKIEEVSEVIPSPPSVDVHELAEDSNAENVPNVNVHNIPDALYDLMRDNNVTKLEIQEVVAKKGYYPIDTPIHLYDKKFVKGVLVGAWNKVFAMIKEIRGGDLLL